jgi:hypothetical protein
MWRLFLGQRLWFISRVELLLRSILRLHLGCWMEWVAQLVKSFSHRFSRAWDWRLFVPSEFTYWFKLFDSFMIFRISLRWFLIGLLSVISLVFMLRWMRAFLACFNFSWKRILLCDGQIVHLVAINMAVWFVYISIWKMLRMEKNLFLRFRFTLVLVSDNTTVHVGISVPRFTTRGSVRFLLFIFMHVSRVIIFCLERPFRRWNTFIWFFR